MPMPSGDKKIHKFLLILATISNVDHDDVVLVGDVES